MRTKLQNRIRQSSVAAGMIAAVLAAPSAFACSSDPVLSSICIMPVARPGTMMGMYVPAAGQSLSVSQNAALYSLIGLTYGGNGTNFNLPDLKGRVIVGAGIGPDGTNYVNGGKGGVVSTTLTSAYMPAHSHAVTGTGLTAQTSLSGLSGSLSSIQASANLADIPFASSSSDLVLNVNNSSGGLPTPSGNILSGAAPGRAYNPASSGFGAQLAAGTISGSVSGKLSGTAPVTVQSSTVTITGSATTTIGGVNNSGTAGSLNPTPIPNMQPYLVLTYHICTAGLYPTWD